MHQTNHQLTMKNLGGIPASLLGTSSDPLPRWSRNRSRGALLLIRKTYLVSFLNQLIKCQIWGCALFQAILYNR